MKARKRVQSCVFEMWMEIYSSDLTAALKCQYAIFSSSHELEEGNGSSWLKRGCMNNFDAKDLQFFKSSHNKMRFNIPFCRLHWKLVTIVFSRIW